MVHWVKETDGQHEAAVDPRGCRNRAAGGDAGVLAGAAIVANSGSRHPSSRVTLPIRGHHQGSGHRSGAATHRRAVSSVRIPSTDRRGRRAPGPHPAGHACVDRGPGRQLRSCVMRWLYAPRGDTSAMPEPQSHSGCVHRLRDRSVVHGRESGQPTGMRSPRSRLPPGSDTTSTKARPPSDVVSWTRWATGPVNRGP